MEPDCTFTRTQFGGRVMSSKAPTSTPTVTVSLRCSSLASPPFNSCDSAVVDAYVCERVVGPQSLNVCCACRRARESCIRCVSSPAFAPTWPLQALLLLLLLLPLLLWHLTEARSHNPSSRGRLTVGGVAGCSCRKAAVRAWWTWPPWPRTRRCSSAILAAAAALLPPPPPAAV